MSRIRGGGIGSSASPSDRRPGSACVADLLLAEPERVLTAEGRPYGVFTPFRNTMAGPPGHTPSPCG